MILDMMKLDWSYTINYEALIMLFMKCQVLHDSYPDNSRVSCQKGPTRHA